MPDTRRESRKAVSGSELVDQVAGQMGGRFAGVGRCVVPGPAHAVAVAVAIVTHDMVHDRVDTGRGAAGLLPGGWSCG